MTKQEKIDLVLEMTGIANNIQTEVQNRCVAYEAASEFVGTCLDNMDEMEEEVRGAIVTETDRRTEEERRTDILEEHKQWMRGHGDAVVAIARQVFDELYTEDDLDELIGILKNPIYGNVQVAVEMINQRALQAEKAGRNYSAADTIM